MQLAVMRRMMWLTTWLRREWLCTQCGRRTSGQTVWDRWQWAADECGSELGRVTATSSVGFDQCTPRTAMRTSTQHCALYRGRRCNKVQQEGAQKGGGDKMIGVQLRV